MIVKNLYDVCDSWTHLLISDVDGTILYDDMILSLEEGIKESWGEISFFDEEKEKILQKKVLEINAVGENKMYVKVM